MPATKTEEPSRTGMAKRLRNLSLAGLATVIPIVGTVFLLNWIYRALLAVGRTLIYGIVRAMDWFRGAKYQKSQSGEFVRIDEETDMSGWLESMDELPSVIWFLVPLTLLFCLGMAVTNRPGQAVVNWVDKALTRIPFMGFFYSTIKQGVDAFRDMGGARKFKGVAWVAFTSPGCRLLGFVTGTFQDARTGEMVTSVFVPTSPNPMTGFSEV